MLQFAPDYLKFLFLPTSPLYSTYGDCPIVVSAKTGGLGVCERPGEEPANILAADQVTRTMKVEVREYNDVWFDYNMIFSSFFSFCSSSRQNL